MSEAATKLPAKADVKGAAAPSLQPEWRPFENLRHEIERIFDNFDVGSWRGRPLFGVEPFARHDAVWGTTPVVDVVEKDNAYEITAELPGMDAKDIDIKFAHGMLTIKGEKKEEKEEKKKDYYLSERRYGSFQRSFQAPDGVDPDKIEASFEKGVLKIALPKTAQAKDQEKKIAITTK